MAQNKDIDAAYSEIEKTIDSEIKAIKKEIRKYEKMSFLKYAARNIIPGYGIFDYKNEEELQEKFQTIRTKCFSLLPQGTKTFRLSFTPVEPGRSGLFVDIVGNYVDLLKQYISALENLQMHLYNLCESLKK